MRAARHYIRTGPIASYERFGFGLLLVVRKEDEAPIGICGLLKRDTLEDVDIGFAYLPAFWSKGYAIEAASAVMDYGRRTLGLARIVAVTKADNAGSIRVLEKLGLKFGKMVRLGPDEPEIRTVRAAETVRLKPDTTYGAGARGGPARPTLPAPGARASRQRRRRRRDRAPARRRRPDGAAEAAA